MATQSIAPSAETAAPAPARVRLPDLEQWVASLPFANPASVMDSVSRELSRLNAAQVKGALRLKLLEVHAGAYDRLVGGLTRAQRRACSSGARTLAMRLAAGYGRLVGELVKPGRGWLAGDKSLAVAAQRQCAFLTHALLHGYDEYAAADARVWSQLERLHAMASERGFAQRPAPGTWMRGEMGACIDHLYKRALLTGFADPHRFGRGEIWRVYDLLGAHAEQAQITSSDRVSERRGVFVIDPSDLRHGASLEHLDTERSHAGLQVLDTRAVTEALRGLLEKLRVERPGSAQDARERRERHSLARRVLRMLETPGQRAGERRGTNASVRLAVGIGATHEALGVATARRARASFDSPKGSGRPVSMRDRGDDEERPPRDDSLKMIDPRSGATVDVLVAGKQPAERGAKATEAEGDDGPLFGLDEWQVADRSPRGIGIVKDGRPAVPVGVGEVVAFSARSTPWMFGIVRWMVVDHAGVHRAGIEVLSNAAAPVQVRASGAGSETRRAALLLRKANGRERGKMIAPPGTYVEDRVYEVQEGEDVARLVRAGELLDTSAACEVFAFEDVASPSGSARAG